MTKLKAPIYFVPIAKIEERIKTREFFFLSIFFSIKRREKSSKINKKYKEKSAILVFIWQVTMGLKKMPKQNKKEFIELNFCLKK